MDPFLIVADKMDEIFDDEDALSETSYDALEQGDDSKMDILANLLGI